MDFIDPEMETTLARTAENLYDIFSWISAKTMAWCMYYLLEEEPTDYHEHLSDYADGVIENRVSSTRSNQLIPTTIGILHKTSSKNKLTDDWTVIDYTLA